MRIREPRTREQQATTPGGCDITVDARRCGTRPAAQVAMECPAGHWAIWSMCEPHEAEQWACRPCAEVGAGEVAMTLRRL